MVPLRGSRRWPLHRTTTWEIVSDYCLGCRHALAILGGIAALFVYVLAVVVVAFYVAKVVVAFLAGRLLLARVRSGWAQGRFAPLLAGVLLGGREQVRK